MGKVRLDASVAGGALHGANVLLVTIDTLRADYLGAYGSHDSLTPTLDKLAAEVKRILREPEVTSALANVGGDAVPLTPDEFDAFVRTERAKWAEVVKASGVRIE